MAHVCLSLYCVMWGCNWPLLEYLYVWATTQLCKSSFMIGNDFLLWWKVLLYLARVIRLILFTAVVLRSLESEVMIAAAVVVTNQMFHQMMVHCHCFTWITWKMANQWMLVWRFVVGKWTKSKVCSCWPTDTRGQRRHIQRCCRSARGQDWSYGVCRLSETSRKLSGVDTCCLLISCCYHCCVDLML